MTLPDAAIPDFTAPHVPADSNGVKDFTVAREPIQFRIGGDLFQAPPVLAVVNLRKLGQLYADLQAIPDLTTADGVDAAVRLVANMMQALLPGSSGRRFAERLLSDGDPGDLQADPPVPPSPEPIDLQREALPVVFWLIEKYGLRPTQPSSSSPAGSTAQPTGDPSPGTYSTDGASPVVSIT